MLKKASARSAFDASKTPAAAVAEPVKKFRRESLEPLDPALLDISCPPLLSRNNEKTIIIYICPIAQWNIEPWEIWIGLKINKIPLYFRHRLMPDAND
jgi:hypothetical protein